jgi:hypothetical protein
MSRRVLIFALCNLIVQTTGWSKPAPHMLRAPVIRRLHLMRPDLIPYPLDVQYYC